MTKHQAVPEQPAPALPIEKLGFTIPEAAQSTSLGQTSIYKAIRDKKLRCRKYGTRSIITRTDLISFLDSLPDETKRPEG